MTTFTPLTDVSLSQDKPVTQSIARAWRDNPLAIGEGDATAPDINQSAFINTAFFAYKSADQSISSSIQDLTFDTEAYDGSSWFDTATGKFTPQSPGLYHIGARVDMTGASTSGNFHISFNNADVWDILVFTASTGLTAKLDTIVRFNGTTDYVTVKWSNGTGGITIKGVQKYLSHFFGYKVGP